MRGCVCVCVCVRVCVRVHVCMCVCVCVVLAAEGACIIIHIVEKFSSIVTKEQVTLCKLGEVWLIFRC